MVNSASWNFDFFNSIPFWLSFALFALLSRLFARSPRLRGVLLAVSSSLMLLAIPQFGLADLALLVALSSVTYFIGLGLIRSVRADNSLRKAATAAGITGVLAFLAFFKYPFFQGLLTDGSGPTETGDMIRMIGVSYFSFRIIHFLVESYRKKIERLSPLLYFNYVTFFPSFISGPINRYNQFSSQFGFRDRPDWKRDLKVGGERIVHGLFKKFVLAQALFPFILASRPESLAQVDFPKALLGLYAYALYFYFDFAGYSDMAIGCARILGVELPENFNNPFLKRNIRELWTNWHISLTSWLVDHIYWPIVRKFRSFEVFRKHPILLSNVGMIITFIACGMWHGETVNFILWGAYHGLGISALTIYQRKKKAVRSMIVQRYFRSRISHAFGVFLTFNYFSVGLVLFVLDFGKLRILASSILSRI